MVTACALLAVGSGLLAVASAIGPASSAEREDLAELVAKIEAHYDAVRDFEADFTQRYERKLLRRVVEERGRVYVKKPGRMRWEYLSPEEKLFVTDGSRSYFYLPEEKQVMVSHRPQGAMGMEEGSPFEILAGRSRLTESFELFPSDSPPARGGVVLHLMPMTNQVELQDVELEVDESTGRVLRVALIDAQNNRTEFLFDSVRENVNIPEHLFRFTIPPDVEVLVQSETPGAAP